MLKISLLGSPQLELDGRLIQGLRRKNRALLYYIAARHEPVTRDELLATFWNTHDPTDARHLLRTMLYELRRQLNGHLLTDGDVLTLLDTQVDTQLFETQLASSTTDPQSLENALSLFRGDFLRDFPLQDSEIFDDWVLRQREHYRGLALRGWATLSEFSEQQGNYDAALMMAERGLAIDPLQEDLQRSVMQLYYLKGDRSSAIRRYDSLIKLLDKELGVPPMSETRRLYDIIISDEARPVPAKESVHRVPSTSTPTLAFLPFVGRTAELKFASDYLHSDKLLLVEGEPGIGKTRFVEELLRHYRAPQRPSGGSGKHFVLQSTACESEQGLPYQPMIDALRGLLQSAEWRSFKTALRIEPIWLAEVSRLIPELGTYISGVISPSASADESRLMEGLRQFLTALAACRPLVLFLDDVHWADTATLNFVSYLVRRSTALSITLLATARAGETVGQLTLLLNELERANRLVRLTLTALLPEDISALARQYSPDDSIKAMDWLTSHTDGNPFFLTEVMRYALDKKILHQGRVEEKLAASMPILPLSIVNLILSRVIRLSDEARRVVDVAAVIGFEFSKELLIHVVKLPEERVLGALDELQRKGLIRPYVTALRFDHMLTQDVVCQHMGVIRLQYLHRCVAEALEALAASDNLAPRAGIIAYHFAKAELNERAAYYTFLAGKHAAQLATWADAIALYDRVLAVETDPQQRTIILIEIGDAYLNLGETEKASLSFEAAIASGHVDPAIIERAYDSWALAAVIQARYGEVIKAGEELRKSGRREFALVAEFMCGTGLMLQSAKPVEAEHHLREALRLSYEHTMFTSRVTQVKIKYQIAGSLGQQGRFQEAIALYLEVLALIRQDETQLDLQRQVLLRNNLAYYLHLVGDASAANYAREGLALAQHKGTLTHQAYLLSTSGEIALKAGDLDAAQQFFRDGLALAEELHIYERVAGLTANLGLVAKERGEFDLARAHLSLALALADQLGAQQLAVRIRIWLLPLLPDGEARQMLYQARQQAQSSHYDNLLEEIARLEKTLS